MDAHKVAQTLVRKFKTRNPFEVAAYQKIKVMTLTLPQHIRGMAIKALRRKYIILNHQLQHWEVKAVCAHELGHHNCHPGASYQFIEEHSLFSPGRFEREANEFAAALLIDERWIESGDSFEEVAAKAEVPVKLVEYFWGYHSRKGNSLIADNKSKYAPET